MMHRTLKPDDVHLGKWNGLGGKLEPGETPEDCVIREVYEESGLQIVKPEFHGVLTFPHFADSEDWYVFIFVARHFQGEVAESTEGKLAWIPDQELASLNLWEGDRYFLQWLDRDQFFSGKFEYEAGKLTEHEVVFYTRTKVSASVRREHPTKALLHTPPFDPTYDPSDDTYCWLCGGDVVKRHCKIVCLTCGFMRDCGDP